MMKRLLLFVAVGALVAGAIGIWWAIRPLPDTPVSGFKPFGSFRASDAPGTVYRLSQDGVIRKVIKLDVPTEAASEVTYNIEAKRKFSIAELLTIAHGDQPCAPANLGFDASATSEITVNSIEGQREFTYDAKIDPALKDLKQLFIDGEIEYRKSDTYWVIRETISTKEISYSSSRNWIVGAKAELALKECADKDPSDGSVSLDTGSAETVTLKRTFEEPLRGWYSAEMILVEKPFGAGPGTPPDIKLAPEAEQAKHDAPYI